MNTMTQRVNPATNHVYSLQTSTDAETQAFWVSVGNYKSKRGKFIEPELVSDNDDDDCIDEFQIIKLESVVSTDLYVNLSFTRRSEMSVDLLVQSAIYRVLQQDDLAEVLYRVGCTDIICTRNEHNQPLTYFYDPVSVSWVWVSEREALKLVLHPKFGIKLILMQALERYYKVRKPTALNTRDSQNDMLLDWLNDLDMSLYSPNQPYSKHTMDTLEFIWTVARVHFEWFYKLYESDLNFLINQNGFVNRNNVLTPPISPIFMPVESTTTTTTVTSIQSDLIDNAAANDLLELPIISDDLSVFAQDFSVFEDSTQLAPLAPPAPIPALIEENVDEYKLMLSDYLDTVDWTQCKDGRVSVMCLLTFDVYTNSAESHCTLFQSCNATCIESITQSDCIDIYKKDRVLTEIVFLSLNSCNDYYLKIQATGVQVLKKQFVFSVSTM